MKIITLILIILVASIGSFFFFKESKAETCGGRCTGSSYCSACKNCTGCAHCNSGGSCGVCSSGKSKPTPPTKTYSTPKSNSNNSSSKENYSSSNETNAYSSENSNSITVAHFVKSQTLNIRKEPSTTAAILCTLNKEDAVILLEKYSEKWAKVKAVCNDETIIGFVYSEYLSE